MTTWSEHLRADAERRGMPLRTIEQVRACLKRAKKTNADISMARLMINHGRLTDDARAYVETYYNERR